MAQFETWLRTDLKKPVQVTVLRGMVFSLDHEANRIGVEVLDGGQPAALSGAVTGYVIRDDGQTVTVTQGTGIQGNRAWMVLPQEAYAVPGRVSIVIKLLSGGAETTLAACTGTVYRSMTDSAVAPTGTPIPDLAQLNAAIQAANSAAASAGQFAAGCIAAAYDYNTDYAAGDYVTYNGRLYRCLQAEAGMIRPAHGAVMNGDYWTPVLIADEMEVLAQRDAAGPYIAGEYAQDGGYAPGDYVIFNGRLYRCTQEEGAIVIEDGETLDANYWTPVTVGEELRRGGAAAAIWSGRKWVCVGDSLTDENYTTTKHYFDYIAEDTGITVVNMGNGGSGYRKKQNENRAFYQRIESGMPTDADIVTIFGSVNDLNQDDGDRTWSSLLGAPTDRSSDTICGCVNLAIDAVYTKIPLARLGIVLPTPCVSAWNSEAGRLANADDTVTILRKWHTYTQALITICEDRGIPYLNLFRLSSLRPWESAYREMCYSRDRANPNDDLLGTHPDERGHAILAPLFKAFLGQMMPLEPADGQGAPPDASDPDAAAFGTAVFGSAVFS